MNPDDYVMELGGRQFAERGSKKVRKCRKENAQQEGRERKINWEKTQTAVNANLRACSHEPGTVNYPGVMIAPGQALPRVHMICCPGASSSSSDHCEFILIPLVFAQIVTENEF